MSIIATMNKYILLSFIILLIGIVSFKYIFADNIKNNINQNYNSNNIKMIPKELSNYENDTINLSKLKVPGTIALLVSDIYPFTKSRIWNQTEVKENITIYVFLGNYLNETHEFILFTWINYTQQEFLINGNLKKLYPITLETDEYKLLNLTVCFEDTGIYYLQIGIILDPYKKQKYIRQKNILPPGNVYLSPKILVNVNKSKSGDDKNAG